MRSLAQRARAYAAKVLSERKNILKKKRRKKKRFGTHGESEEGPTKTKPMIHDPPCSDFSWTSQHPFGASSPFSSPCRTRLDLTLTFTSPGSGESSQNMAGMRCRRGVGLGSHVLCRWFTLRVYKLIATRPQEPRLTVSPIGALHT